MSSILIRSHIEMEAFYWSIQERKCFFKKLFFLQFSHCPVPCPPPTVPHPIHPHSLSPRGYSPLLKPPQSLRPQVSFLPLRLNPAVLCYLCVWVSDHLIYVAWLATQCLRELRWSRLFQTTDRKDYSCNTVTMNMEEVWSDLMVFFV